MYIDIEELRVEADIAYKLGNYRFASNLMDAIDTIEVYTKPEGFMPPSSAIFNRAKTPLVKESFTSPKCIKWTPELDKLLVSTLVDKGETYGAFTKSCGIDGVTEGAVRNRIYKLGYRRPADKWIKS